MRTHLRFPVVLLVVVGLLAWGLGAAAAPANQEPAPGEEAAVGSGFTYQGLLTNGEEPVNDTCRMIFRVYNAQSSGVQVGDEQVIDSVQVANGIFTVVLNGSGQFGPNFVNGQERWLQVSVRCGNEQADTTLPRQALTAAPYALTALTALSANGLRGRNVSEAAPTNGQVLGWNGTEWTPQNSAVGGSGDITAVNAGQGLTGGGTSGDVSLALNTTFTDNRYWQTGGNAGTNPTDNFLGTTDNQPLEIRVNNTRVLRIEPTLRLGDPAPNIIHGIVQNGPANGAVGIVIGGGGDESYPNVVYDHFGAIGGGTGNEVGTDDGDPVNQQNATVAGGGNNYARGANATVSGGTGNVARALNSTVGGGTTNDAAGEVSTIGGGALNVTDGLLAFIGGGEGNTAGGERSTIGGGQGNEAHDAWSTIAGGQSNEADGDWSTVGGGQDNVANEDWSTVGGGQDNEANGRHSTIGGGFGNYVDFGNFGQTIGGGYNNRATGFASTVPGGADNQADGNYSFAAGRQAYVQAEHSGTFIWADNHEDDFTSTNSNQFLIRADNGVGIGEDAPENQLHVLEFVAGNATPDNHVAQIQNTGGPSADVLALKVAQIGSNVNSSNNYVTFFDGNNLSLGSIEGSGTGTVTYAGPGNDYAEWLPKRDPTEGIDRGEIVGVFGGQVSRATAGADRVMALSTGAIVAGNDPGEEQRDAHALVAFIGQVQIPVRGPVQAGDFILPSGLDDGTGIALAPEALQPEQFTLVVGQAWESSGDEALKSIRTVVGLMQQDPTVLRLVMQVQALEERLAALEAQIK